MGRMESESGSTAGGSRGLTAPVALAAAQIEMEQEYGQQRDSYYAEIVEIMAGGKLTAAYIAHHPEIYKQDERNHNRAFDFHGCSSGDSSGRATR